MIDKQTLAGYLPNGKTVSYEKKKVLCIPHQKVTTIHWLLRGTLDYYVSLEKPKKSILVNKISEPMTLVGWSGFNSPGRFSHTVVVGSKEALFFEVPLQDLMTFVSNTQDAGLLREICRSLYHQLGSSLQRQLKLLQPLKYRETISFDDYFISAESSEREIMELMRKSPFLEKFDETELLKLVALVERRDYESEEVIYQQDSDPAGLYVIIQGEVAISRIEEKLQLKQRSLSTPGFIFGWSSLIGEQDICTARSTHKTSVYFIPKSKLEALFSTEATLATHFYLHLIWLVGNQLNASFLRFISLTINHDHVDIHHLVENSRSRLKLSSPVHQVPHLLKEVTTKHIAYEILHLLNREGDAIERHIASLSLEFLKQDEEEFHFISGLKHIYKIVAENDDLTPAQRRKDCAKATRELFQHLSFKIEGQENIPQSRGNIFIYNHLLNHPYYTLNNGFQITLDSHFISGLLLDPKYNEPGIRTVRVGKGQEYGHQDYYDNLGYINVYTKDSDSPDEQAVKQSRGFFYEQASTYLKKGTNLIVSPEGTSYTTEESPGLFKTGAFNLALSQEEEPLIVPIVLCNFDRRITDNLFYCKILEPFKVSAKLKKNDKDQLKSFVIRYQQEFAEEVEIARKRVEYLISNDLM